MSRHRTCDWQNCTNLTHPDFSYEKDNYRWYACGIYHLQLLIEHHHQEDRKREHKRRVLAHLEAQTEAQQ